MAVRLTKEVWALIRNEYEAGATAVELAARYKGVKFTSIHARAGREKWRYIDIPPSHESSRYAANRAKVEGISIDEATKRESIDQNHAISSHRAEVTLLGALLTDGLHLASEASKQNNSEIAKSAAALISSVREATTALHLKIRVARIAYGLDPCPPFSSSADYENFHGSPVAQANNSSEIKSEVL